MTPEFARPWMLLWLPALLVLAVVFSRRSLVDRSLRQKRIHLTVRSLILTLLVLAAAGLTWIIGSRNQTVVFLLDVSRSVDAAAADDLLAALPAPPPNCHAVILPFAAEPSEAVQAVPPQSSVRTEQAVNDDQETDIEKAILAGAARIPSGRVPRLVLLSDGNQTTGHAVSAAAAAGIPVDVLAIPPRRTRDVLVSEIRAPDTVRQGAPFVIDAVIDATDDDDGFLELYRGPHLIARRHQPLHAGTNTFRFEQTLEDQRLAEFTVRFSGAQHDTVLENNAASAVVRSTAPPRVLMIERHADRVREFLRVLRQEGIPVDVRPPAGMPERLSDLQNYDLLIISDVPATDLSEQQMELAALWVRETGGGMLMVGGPESFGPGGYHQTPLETILPVHCDVEDQQNRPGLAMVLLIDRSGSMDGTKLAMAKAAAQRAVEVLGPRDQMAILAFDEQTRVISPLRPVSDGPIDARIGRLSAGGGTAMYPAMQTAFEMLQGTAARLKHVLILTDGVSSPGDFSGIAAAMAGARITVSAVAVGADADRALLEEITRIGRGRFYFTDDPEQIPRIFARETVAASQSGIDEDPFLPQLVRATRVLQQVDMNTAPFLLGCVRTRAKSTAEVILTTESGDPLLAWWRYGLGMTAAFTSDVADRWAAEWLAWPRFGRFWAQTVRHLLRTETDESVRIRTERIGSTTRITADITDRDGAWISQADVDITLLDPRLRPSQHTLRQTAPGRYQADVSTPQTGLWSLTLRARLQNRILCQSTHGFSVGYRPELRLLPVHHTLLRQVAQVSGGRVLDNPTQVFAQDGRTARRPVELWPALLILALLLHVVDVALRRMDGRVRPTGLIRAFRGANRSAAEPPAPPPAAVPASLPRSGTDRAG